MSRLGRAGTLGLVTLVVVALACALGPLVSPYGVDEQDLAARDQGPSRAHPFGTADLGEDVLTRVLDAGRTSLVVGLATALLASALGAGLGLVAGARGGWVDAVLSRLTDLFLIVPGFVVLIVLSLTFESVGVAEVVLILSLLSWPPLFRLTRASALRTRELPSVDAARVAGASGLRIARTHLLRAATPEVTAFAALAVGGAMLAESALSFLSLGLSDGSLSWGVLLTGAQDTVEDRWWLTVFPGAAILITVLATAALAEAARRALSAAPAPVAGERPLA